MEHSRKGTNLFVKTGAGQADVFRLSDACDLSDVQTGSWLEREK